jgi:hypothetical protein
LGQALVSQQKGLLDEVLGIHRRTGQAKGIAIYGGVMLRDERHNIGPGSTLARLPILAVLWDRSWDFASALTGPFHNGDTFP